MNGIKCNMKEPQKDYLEMSIGKAELEFLISINMQRIKLGVGRGWGLISSFNLIYD